MPPKRTLEDYPIITQMHPEDDAWFKANPNVAGRAAFEEGAVLLNPYSPLSSKEKAAVAQNERLRLFMRDVGYEPKFAITDEQRSFFEGTPYAKDENAMRETILSRIFSGDPSVKPTEEQRGALEEVLWQERRR